MEAPFSMIQLVEIITSGEVLANRGDKNKISGLVYSGSGQVDIILKAISLAHNKISPTVEVASRPLLLIKYCKNFQRVTLLIYKNS